MLKGILNKVILAAVSLVLFASCGREGAEVPVNTYSPIYPDYMGVTVPSNIAPLNFHYTSTGIRKAHTTVMHNGDVREFEGKEVM